MDVRPFWLAGSPATGEAELTVTNPHDGRVVGIGSVPSPDQVEQAVAAAHAVRKEAAALPIHVRAEALAHVSRRLSERAEEIAQLISAENGKPIFWARGEVGRAVATFRFAAEETRRFSGDVQRLDTEAPADGRLAYVSRQPYGPVLAVTPFNFPLNLVAHKVAPAIAVGAPVIVKPARDPALFAAARRDPRRDGPSRGHVLGAAGAERPRGRAGRGPAPPGGVVHRLRARRVRHQGPGAP